jgi:hypothetical protein
VKKKLVLIILVGFIFFSCEKAAINKTDSILGRWNWKTTTGGIAGSKYTPEYTRKKIIIEFTSDSIYKKYQNDTLTLVCSFHTFSDTSESQLKDNLILFENHTTFEHYSVINYNTLFLSDKMVDGFTSEFERIK